MGRIFLYVFMLVILQPAFCQISMGRDSLSVLFWNVENFYDHIDQGRNRGEKDFSSTGSRHWTYSRFYTKCNAIAKAIMSIGDGYCDGLPDVVGFAEVENRGVLTSLFSNTVLYKADYKIVHYDSSDKRGIDVALVYRDSEFELESSAAFKVQDASGGIIPTRDILTVALRSRKSGALYHFIVNHHPSKFGGNAKSSISRQKALEKLKWLCDSLAASGTTIVMGDFNETADHESFKMLDSIVLNLANPLAGQGRGTIRFNGKWDMIDMFFVSHVLRDRAMMQIVELEHLMTEDRTHTGYKPFRTFSGPRYIGGVSDHCPILLKIY